MSSSSSSSSTSSSSSSTSPFTVKRRSLTKSAAVAAAALVLPTGSGVARAAGGGGFTLRLPAPTGPHRVGVTTLHMTDRSRRDPWQPESDRELMVSVLHPARDVHGYPVAPQMTARAAQSFQELAPLFHPELPKTGVDWAATMAHARTGAPVRTGRRPVLLYSPGGGDPRTLGTSVAEELASHGCVVVTIDHPGDATEVEFPDGSVRTTVFRGDPRTDPALFRTVIETRIADTRFVLDQLEALAAGRSELGRAMDLRRVGIYGHSAGGTAAAEAMHEDRRIKAAVNIEGFLDHPDGELFPVAKQKPDRPLLLIGSDGFSRRKELERSWSVMQGVPRRQVGNATHWVFTDYASMAPQLQETGLMSAQGRNSLIGTIAPKKSVPLVRDYLHTFFSRHLRDASGHH
ncbi:alpha/beta hydrolase family protein [Streptomyces sp. 8N114]|uniref:alpha/beta hydrolase family protein n=1 Tax=Streptomyces sp. 8N114 TaxID=3457419 RepID=UPI003FD12EA2